MSTKLIASLVLVLVAVVMLYLILRDPYWDDDAGRRVFPWDEPDDPDQEQDPR